jgi:hypothetical protein
MLWKTATPRPELLAIDAIALDQVIIEVEIITRLAAMKFSEEQISKVMQLLQEMKTE